MQAFHLLGDADDVVQDYSRLVHHVAKRFKWALSPSLEYSDLVSEGTIGLLKAYNGFDPDRGVKFVTFATRMIQWQIQRHLKEFERTLSVPSTLYELAGKILRHRLNDLPPSEIAKKLDSSEERVQEALDYLQLKLDSIDRPLPGTDNEKITIQDMIPTLDDQSGVEVREFLRSLTNRERQLVELRLSYATQREIGKVLNCSQVHVGRIQESIGEKYKRFMEVEDLAKLTKEKYLELKAQGKNDPEIRSIYGIGEPSFVRQKKEWGVFGMRKVSPGKAFEVSSRPATNEAIPEKPAIQAAPPASPAPDNSVLQRMRSELESAKSIVASFERENQLLRALLKNYL